MKKFNQLSILALLTLSVFLVGCGEKHKKMGELPSVNKYSAKTARISIDYPDNSKDFEEIFEDRIEVDEHIKFKVSDKDFKEDLIIEFIITNSLAEKCVEVECRNLPLDSSESLSCQECGRFENLANCYLVEDISEYCPYYKGDYITENRKDSYVSNTGDYMGYISGSSDWKKKPVDFEGVWRTGKTRKWYEITNSITSELGEKKRAYIIAWFQSGDNKAEKTVDNLVKYGVNF